MACCMRIATSSLVRQIVNISEELQISKMAVLPQFDYLFAIGTIFSFLDAWNIGTSSTGLGNDPLSGILVACPVLVHESCC